MSMTLWADEGPASQGKIITAILRSQLDETGDEIGTARTLLRVWCEADLSDLERAAEGLVRLIRQERGRRRPV